MAKKRTKKITPVETGQLEDTKGNLYQDISSKIRLSESYVSLILGAVVVIGLVVVFFLLIRETRIQAPSDLDTTNIPQSTTPISQRTYILKEGESIWDVAVRFYGDGYRYVEIVEANKLENPDYVPPGTQLIIPNAK
ncbi:MAG: LysM peptidoglycan-binding domain-containing protein [Candidatus Levybacteria bacterium]|nr:LysM peptidoglycan-binding domain-containing protein [Candidatus Levybacteria bacterium]